MAINKKIDTVCKRSNIASDVKEWFTGKFVQCDSFYKLSSVEQDELLRIEQLLIDEVNRVDDIWWSLFKKACRSKK